MINQELPNDPLKIKEIVRQNRRNGNKPARTGYKWTEEEIRSLEQDYLDGDDFSLIALRLQRLETAVLQKARTRNLLPKRRKK